MKKESFHWLDIKAREKREKFLLSLNTRTSSGKLCQEADKRKSV